MPSSLSSATARAGGTPATCRCGIKQLPLKLCGLSVYCPTIVAGCFKHHAIIAFFAMSDNRAKVNLFSFLFFLYSAEVEKRKVFYVFYNSSKSLKAH
jgi:hypothetical protein